MSDATDLEALAAEVTMSLGEPERSFLKFARMASQYAKRVEGTKVLSGGVAEVPCPICSGRASILLDAGENADGAAWCHSGCSPDEVVQDAMEYTARRLPELCDDRHERYHDRNACSRCQAYATALRVVSREVDERYRGERAGLADEDWTATDLADAEPLPPRSILRIGSTDEFLIRPNEITLVFGGFGTGKTPATYLAISEVVKDGGLVALVDYEMAAPMARKTLAEMGLSDDEIRDGLLYFFSPGPMTATGRRRLGEAIEQRTKATGRDFRLAVIDSLTEGMSATVPGSSDNDALDVAVWFASLPKVLVADWGAAVVVIDHSGLAEGPRPSGSHKKLEAVQTAYQVKSDVAFSRSHEKGKSHLILRKDRSGDGVIGEDVAELHTKIGGSFFLTPPQKGSDSTSGDDTVTIDLSTVPDNDADVLSDLRGYGAAGVGRSELTGGGAEGQYRRAALDRLIEKRDVVQEQRGRTKWCVAAEFVTPLSVSS